MRKFYFLLLTLLIGSATAMAANPTLYVKGGFNGWGTANQMTEDNGVYSIHLDKLTGEFQIADADWAEQYGNGQVIQLNTDYVIEGKSNMKTDGSYTNVDLTFNYATKTLRITGEAHKATITYAIKGSFQSAAWDAVPFTEENGKWVATITPAMATGNFGIQQLSDGEQSGYYKGGDVEISEANPTVYLTLESAGGYGDPSFSLTAGKEYTFTFVPESGELSISFNGEVVDPNTLDANFDFIAIGREQPEEDWVNEGTNYSINLDGRSFTSNGVTFSASTNSDAVQFYMTSSKSSIRVRGYYGSQFKVTAPEGYYLESVTFYSDLSEKGSGFLNRGIVENFTAEKLETELPGEATFAVRWTCEPENLTDEFVLTNGDDSGPIAFIYVDVVAKKKEESEPKTFGLVGSLEGNNWNIDNPIEMEANGNVFTYGLESVEAGTAFKVATVGEGWDSTFGAEAPLGSEDAVPVNVTVGEEMNAWMGSSNNFVFEKKMENVTITFTYDDAANAPSKILVEGDVVENPVELHATFDFVAIGNERTDWVADVVGSTIDIADEVFTSDNVTFVATTTGGIAPNLYKTGSGAIRVRLYSGSSLTIKAPAGYYIESATFYTDLSMTGSGLEGGRAVVENFTPERLFPDVLPGDATGVMQWNCNADAMRDEFVMKNGSDTSMLSFTYIDVVAKQSPTGIEGVGADVDENAPVEYYNLNGVRVAEPSNGIFIRRQGNQVSKIIVR